MGEGLFEEVRGRGGAHAVVSAPLCHAWSHEFTATLANKLQIGHRIVQTTQVLGTSSSLCNYFKHGVADPQIANS